MRDVVAALRYLHERSLVHRDIKPQNLLLSGPLADSASVVKVADFGFARSLPPAALASTLCGSPHYMSPELLAFKPYDAKADLWSVGVVLAELLTGRPPFTGANPLDLLRGITQNAWLQGGGDGALEEADTCGGILPPAVAVRTSVQCKAVLRGLLRADPAMRWSHEELFGAAWFSDGHEMRESPAAAEVRDASASLDPVAIRLDVRTGQSGGAATATAQIGDDTVATFILPQPGSEPVAAASSRMCDGTSAGAPAHDCDAIVASTEGSATLYGVTVLNGEGDEDVGEGKQLPALHSVGDSSAVSTAHEQGIPHSAGWADAANFPLALLADTAARGFRAGTLIAESAVTLQSYVRRYVVPSAAREAPTVAPAISAPSASEPKGDIVLKPASFKPDFLAEVLDAVWPRSALKHVPLHLLVSACHVNPVGLPATLPDLDFELKRAEEAAQFMQPSAGLSQLPQPLRQCVLLAAPRAAELNWATQFSVAASVAFDAGVSCGAESSTSLQAPAEILERSSAVPPDTLGVDGALLTFVPGGVSAATAPGVASPGRVSPSLSLVPLDTDAGGGTLEGPSGGSSPSPCSAGLGPSAGGASIGSLSNSDADPAAWVLV